MLSTKDGNNKCYIYQKTVFMLVYKATRLMFVSALVWLSVNGLQEQVLITTWRNC